MNDLRASIAPKSKPGKLKTIECSIMDLADDIAYSTYDIEDAFKAGFLSPVSMAAAPDNLKARIADSVNRKLKRNYARTDWANELLTVDSVDRIVLSLLKALFDPSKDLLKRMSQKKMGSGELSYALSAEVYAASTMLREEGTFRGEFTSKLVYAFVSDVAFKWNAKRPPLSSVSLSIGTFQTIEVLKTFAYESLVMSNRFKMADRRGREIVEYIFKALKQRGGERLLPDDVRSVYEANNSEMWKMRTICDFIASMTDRYCINFYSRLTGIDAPSIYVPY